MMMSHDLDPRVLSLLLSIEKERGPLEVDKIYAKIDSKVVKTNKRKLKGQNVTGSAKKVKKKTFIQF